MNQIKIKNFSWNLLKKLANLNFSIFMLLFIAFLSMIGTIIEQERDLQFYQVNYPLDNNIFHLFHWKSILFLGIDHIYTTWWFLFIIILFFLSLLVCTISTQLPVLNNSRNWKFLYKNKNIKNVTEVKSVYNNSLSNMIVSLISKNYYVFHKSGSLYAYKGLLGRISPIFVHISIVLVLIGSIVGLGLGFIVQEMIPSHEIFHIDNILKVGSYSILPKNILVKVNDFSILYHKNGSIKQFISNISLMSNEGSHLISKKISVNNPLKFHGITLYQTDWVVNSLRFTIGDSTILQKKINKVVLVNKNIWVCTIPVSSNQQFVLVIRDLQSDIEFYNLSGEFLYKKALNQPIVINNTSFICNEILLSTGLQIKTDPGVSIVYLGFSILIISIITSYISYAQIWITNKNDSLVLYGSTNRAALSFEEDCTAIQQMYLEYNDDLFNV